MPENTTDEPTAGGMDGSSPDDDGNSGFADPESPNSKADSTGSSSEGVLVEHPAGSDQDPRGLHGDHDGGILVDIDGSMMEHAEEKDERRRDDDAGREEMFLDAQDQLAFSEGRRSVGLEESLAMIEIRENSGRESSLVDEIARLRAQLEERDAECRAYKEERNTIKDLRFVIDSKDAEIHELSRKLCENEVSREVVASYLDSVRDVRYDALKESLDASVRRILAELSSVVETDVPLEGSFDEKMNAVEEKMKVLIDKHTLFVGEIEQLGRCLGAGGGSNFTMPSVDQFGLVFDATRLELLEGRRKELEFLGKIGELEQEKSKALVEVEKMTEALQESKSEVSRCKVEVEQAENKFLTVKEKLSIAVTKGKSLVQQRESLKQSLTQKTGELEKCLQDLQQKSAALEASEAVYEELMRSKEMLHSLECEASEKGRILHTIERDISEIGFPEEILNADATGRVKWLVDRINTLEESKVENSKVRAALCSFDLPETVSCAMLDYQINWLGTSLSKAREDAIDLENELKSVQAALGSCESQMLQAQTEIESLSGSLLVEKQGKDSLQLLYDELTSKYEGAAEKISKLLSEKNHLVDVLGEISGSNLEGEAFDNSDISKDKYIEMIKEKMHASMVTSSVLEGLQRMQELLYIRSQESMIYEKILEEEMAIHSERKTISEELSRASSEVLSLRNERDTLQKALERSEEKTSLLREKLSMAVKKGKGLVQERDGLKHSLDEKNSETVNLKQSLKLQESAVVEYKEQVSALRSDLEQAQKHEYSIRHERDQIELIMLESNNTLQRITESLQQIAPADIPILDPIEKLSYIARHIHECEADKVHIEQELEKQKVEAILHSNKLADAYATIKSLEETLMNKESYISSVLQEKKSAQIGRDSAVLELEKLKEETHALSSELEEACKTAKSLKDALTKAEDRISLLMDERAESDSKSKLAIASLNKKIAAYMEELAGIQRSLENQSTEVDGHLGQLRLLARDDSLPTLMTDIFKKNIEPLRKMIPLLEEIYGRMHSGEVQSRFDPKMENPLSRLLSLPPFEDHVNDNMARSEEKLTSFTEVAEEISSHSTFLGERLGQFSKYLNENLSLLFQTLEATRDEVLHVVEQKESLKLQVNDASVLRDAQEMEISKLQNSVKLLLSACSDATSILQSDLQKMMHADVDLQQVLTPMPESELKVVEGGGSSSEPEDTIQKLLVAAKSFKGQIENLLNLNSNWTGCIGDLKNKLREAELAAESAKEDRDTYLERVKNLEIELHSLQNKQEIAMKDKEGDLLSLPHPLSVKDREGGENLLMDSQLGSLFAQVSKIETPFEELETKANKEQHSSPVDKIFYILDNVSTLKQMLNSVIVERDDLQSTVSYHVDEIQQLKKTLAGLNSTDEELGQKTKEMNEMVTNLGRIVAKLGGNVSLEENKSFDGRGLLSLLERLIFSLREESESYKLKTEELGTKLLDTQKVTDELSTKMRSLEHSIQSKSSLPETKERSLFEASASTTGSEISEVEDVVSLGKKSISPVTAAAHVRTMRKGSSDHLALSIDMESDRLISSYETDDKGHLFKSLNSSGLIPNQGKIIADRVDSIWVSGGRILMGRPEARIGLIAYSILLHIWVLATIL